MKKYRESLGKDPGLSQSFVNQKTLDSCQALECFYDCYKASQEALTNLAGEASKPWPRKSPRNL